MKISLSGVVPAPLKGTLEAESKSDIWQSEITFEQNKKYQIHAPSGKGKSTFVHILYGLRRDFTGEVKVDEKSVIKINKVSWAALRQKKISIVFQNLRLFMDLTALENVQLKAVLYSTNMENEIREMAEYLGVTHVLDKKAALLSYGERQRIAIIRALIQPFEILLLDEPFSHLDEGNIEKACGLIVKKCEANQATMIMTSLGYDYYINFDAKLVL